MRSVTFFGIIAKVGLKGKPSEHEQRRDDRWFVKGMVRMKALHPAAMPDDIVAQLQVIVMPCRLIAETAIRVFKILNEYIIKERNTPLSEKTFLKGHLKKNVEKYSDLCIK